MSIFHAPSRALLLALVLFAGAFPATAGATESNADGAPSVESALPPLPEAITSFGAAIDGDWVYVYGGHIGTAHQHSRDNLARGFYRLNLAQPKEWESLEMGPARQGLALVAHGGTLYRIGGLAARNAKGEPEDLHSSRDVSRFDPATGTWASMTPLPEPRSSHDAVVLGDKLYVVGGWCLRGDDMSGDSYWHDTVCVADLTQSPIVWEEIEAPFARRALAIATAGDQVCVLGGITDDGSVSRSVDCLDTRTGEWSEGPELPMTGWLKGFGVSAFTTGPSLFMSGSAGDLYELEAGGSEWIPAGFQLEVPRFFHRLLVHAHEDRQSVLFLAGASMKSGHLSSIERTTVEARSPKAAAPMGGRWTGFRGDGTSHADPAELPLEWTEDSVAWSLDLPGYGQSSPIVWDDRIFVTSVSGTEGERVYVSAFDVARGEPIWIRSFDAAQTRKQTKYVSRGAPTPVVDDEGVYVFFESGDLLALDHDGNRIWHRALTEEYGKIKGNHGLGTSLVHTPDSLFLLVAHEGPSYLLAVDKETGANRWKIDREPSVSWTTPLLFGDAEEARLIVSSNGDVECFDARSGERRWFLNGLEGNTVASPSADGDIIVVASSKKKSNLAIRSGGRGDIAESHVLWRADDALSSFGSPLIHDGEVYFVNRAGIARSLDLETGEENWATRIGGSCWASPIAAGDRVYFFDKDGGTTVIDATTEEPTVLAKSELEVEEPVHGVAATRESFVLRAGRRLFRVGPTAPEPVVEEPNVEQPAGEKRTSTENRSRGE